MKVTSVFTRSEHPDLDVFKTKGGHLDPTLSDPEMERNIGRKMTFKVLPNQGTNHRKTHFIGGIQRIYDGRLAYRVYTHKGDFGRPALPEEVEWLD